MSDSDTESSSKQPKEGLGTRVRRFFVTVGVAGIVALVAAGLVVYRDMDAERRLDDALEQAGEACDQRLEATESELAAARRDASRLRAHFDLSGAREELQRGNFGNARQHTAAAAKHLEVAGHPKLASKIGAIDIRVTDNLESTDEALLSVERAVGQAIRAANQPAVE